jgi:hypothetical protein
MIKIGKIKEIFHVTVSAELIEYLTGTKIFGRNFYQS